MSYYHIDTLQRYIQSLGFKNINNRSIKVNVNGTTADNSFYSPTTKALTFGTGGVDDAEDAGIIAHEYGHSIQDNQVPGFGSSAEGGAMGEGFGDFLGATYEDAVSTTGYGKACVGEWDATAYSGSDPTCLRRLDNNKVYPKDITNEVHDDGEIWAQGQYEMAQAFGRDVATKIILQSHWSLTPNSKFSDGAKAIKQADALYMADNMLRISIVFGQREELVRINIKVVACISHDFLICFRTGTSKVSYIDDNVNLFAFHLFFIFKNKMLFKFSRFNFLTISHRSERVFLPSNHYINFIRFCSNWKISMFKSSFSTC